MKIIIQKYMNVLKSIKNISFNLKNRISYFFQLWLLFKIKAYKLKKFKSTFILCNYSFYFVKWTLQKYMNLLKSIKNISFNLKNRISYFFQLWLLFKIKAYKLKMFKSTFILCNYSFYFAKWTLQKYMNVLKSIKIISFNLKNRIFCFPNYDYYLRSRHIN